MVSGFPTGNTNKKKTQTNNAQNILNEINKLVNQQNQPTAAQPQQVNVANALNRTTSQTPQVQPPSQTTTPQAPQTQQPTQPKTSTLPTSASTINLSELLERANQVLRPGTELQKEALTSSFNDQMQKLSNQFASRGLLASGVAASQQQQAVQGLAGQMAQLEAAQQERALETAMNQQQFLEGQRQFDKGFSLDEAQVMGRFIPAGARDLINEIVQQKNIWSQPGATQEQKTAANERANMLREQLRIMGVDPTQFGADVGLQDTLKNAQNLRGQQTEAGRQFDAQQGLAERQFDLESELGRARQKLDEDRFGLEREMSEFERAFKTRQQEIDRNLAQQGINIDNARLALSRLQHEDDKAYKNRLLELDISEVEAKRRTSATIADIMQFDTLDEAYEYMYKNAENFAIDGVDAGAVMDALSAKFGEAAAEIINPFAQQEGKE